MRFWVTCLIHFEAFIAEDLEHAIKSDATQCKPNVHIIERNKYVLPGYLVILNLIVLSV